MNFEFVCWFAYFFHTGRFNYRNLSVYTQLERSRCIALRYVDDNFQPTEEYPMNPNGSKCECGNLYCKLLGWSYHVVILIVIIQYVYRRGRRNLFQGWKTLGYDAASRALYLALAMAMDSTVSEEGDEGCFSMASDVCECL